MPTSLLSLVLAAGIAFTAPGEQVRSWSETYDTDGVVLVKLDVPVGEVEIQASSGDRVEIELTLECGSGWGTSRCSERAKRIELVSNRRGDRLVIEIEGYSKWRNRGMHVNLTMRLPAALELEIDMGIGELTLRDLSSDVTVDLGIGEVSLVTAIDHIGSVSLDTGIGEASLRTPEGRNQAVGLLGNEVTWDQGRGTARIKIDLGIGEISVRLS